MTKPLPEPNPESAPRRIPITTYRLQFNRQFTFKQATDLVNYLHQLGITDCYASPIFKAGPESTHGYDVSSFEELNPNLGTRGDFDSFAARLRESGLGLLLDMVPNHMGNDRSNSWWWEVLEKGQVSNYAAAFDIDWHSSGSGHPGKVLLPILEAHYSEVLEACKLQVVSEAGRLLLAYYDRRLPLSKESCDSICKAGGTESDSLKQLNGRPGEPRSFDALNNLLEQQHYRLTYWRVGPEEINYRRFFDVPELVSLRMERPEVFQATHKLLFSLVKAANVTGLRIDHPDGLWNPKQYLHRLQEALNSTSTPSGGDSPPRINPIFLVVEKILSGDETLPWDWPVDGTTGYDFLNRVNSLFVDCSTREAFNEIYRTFTGSAESFEVVRYASKKQVLQTSFAADLIALTRRLKAVAVSTRYGLDFTWPELRTALTEIIAAFPVYRTYTTEDARDVSPADKLHINYAIRRAQDRNTQLEIRVFDFIQNLLLLHPPADLDDSGISRSREFVMRFQQVTGPVMAKGLEDTAFYRFNRLVSLNEVGGDPDAFGVGVEKFHQHNLLMSEQWPHTLLATATHDTKRGEDVRARINVLSEIPEEWQRAVTRWSAQNASSKQFVNGEPAPHPNDEYLLYQTLIGSWPHGNKSADADYTARITAYMLKALKEAKARTSWLAPDTDYETATRVFVEKILSGAASNQFLHDFMALQRKTSYFGQFNSLSQVLLKITSPGVPDFYQGTELWDLSLVDPDNRRPVDYDLRRRLLADTSKTFQAIDGQPHMDEFISGFLNQSHTGQVKLYLIWRALEFRRSHPSLFLNGAYVPLVSSGEKKNHVCAFVRMLGNDCAVTIAPRLVVGLCNEREQPPIGAEIWGDTFIQLPAMDPGGHFENLFTGQVFRPSANRDQHTFPLSEALANFPVALLKWRPLRPLIKKPAH